MLGTHAVRETRLGKLPRQVLEKQNLFRSGCIPLLAKSPNLLMTCPVCGKASTCVHARRNTSALVDHMAGSDIFAGDGPGSPAPESALRAGSQQPEQAWRQEVVSRVQQHRARRRRPADPDALELDFSADSPHSFGTGQQDCPMPPPPERFAEILVPQKIARQSMVKPEPRVIRFPRPQPAYVPTIEEVRLDELEFAETATEILRFYVEAGPVSEVTESV